MSGNTKRRSAWKRGIGPLICVTASATILFSVSACVLGSPAGSFCGTYEPVYTSPQDTPETRDQVDRNNVVWAEECPPETG